MRTAISHEFVDTIPDHLEDGVIYISVLYATAVHSCCCGCGHEVVTPLHPRQWSLTFDGESISLTPSIGNWSFPCRSHYWIRFGQVHRARRFSDFEVTHLRAADRELLVEHYRAPSSAAPGETARPRERWWTRPVRWLKGRLQ